VALNAIAPKALSHASAVADALDVGQCAQPTTAAPPVDRVSPRQYTLLAPNNPKPVLAPPRQAAASESTHICDSGRCSPEAKRISDAFDAGSQVDLTTLPRVFSGKMHWLSTYDANSDHFAGILLDTTTPGSYTFKGMFEFYGSTDPYASTSIEKARAWSSGHPVQIKDGYLFVDSNPNWDAPDGGPQINYWLRQDPATRKVYLLAYWGGLYGVGELEPRGE